MSRASSSTQFAQDPLWAVRQLHDILASQDGTLRALTALAVEGQLGTSAMVALGASAGAIAHWLDRRWILLSGEVRPLSIAKHGPTEPAYRLAAGLRQRVLRAAESKRLLGPLTLELEELLSGRSKASLVRKLQQGSLIFRPEVRHTVHAEVSFALYESVMDAFDPDWLQRTWGKRTSSVVGQILHTSLVHLLECRPLVHFCLETPELLESSDIRLLLSIQAIFEQEGERARNLINGLSSVSQMEVSAVVWLAQGQVDLAQQMLSSSQSFSKQKYPPLHPLSPLLALLWSKGTNNKKQERDPVKWLCQRGADENYKAQGKALRLVLSLADQGDGKLRRIDVHQVPHTASAFELLLLGLATYVHVQQEVARSAWAKRLAEYSFRWLDRGYFWQGRQALVLASALDRTQLDQTIKRAERDIPVSDAAVLPQPGDLISLVRVPSSWELGLAVLDRLARTEVPATRYRIEWYVDPASGTVNHPGLHQFESGHGWHLERRLTLGDVIELKEDLPPEDRIVVDVIARLDLADENSHLPLFEALVGHNRVVDGTRGAAKIEITRGEPYVVTEEEEDHVRVGFRPQGLGPGLNLVKRGEDRLEVVFVSQRMEEVAQALSQDLRVPHAEISRALDVLSKLGDGVTVRSPHLQAQQIVQADSTPVLRFTPIEGAWLIEVGVQPFGSEGRFFHVETGPGMLTLTSQGRRFSTTRSFPAENDRVAELVAACPTLVSTDVDEPSGKPRFILGEAQVLTLLEELRTSRLNHHLAWPEKTRLSVAGSVSVGALRGALRAHKGWYLLSGNVALDKVTSVSLAELLQLPIVHGGRYLRLPTGDFVRLDQKFRALARALAGCPTVGRAVQLDLGRLATIRKVLEESDVDVERRIQNHLDQLDASLACTQAPPEALQAKLRDYQLQGFRWLYTLSQLGLGACLADDMGLGKTVQIIAFLLSRPSPNRHLVVAPTSVCTNWLREIERFAPTLAAREYNPASDTGLITASSPPKTVQQGEVLIISYQQLSETSVDLRDVEWDTVVLDEAQYIKNPKTQRALSVLELSAKKRIAATGTPIENHLGDLWGVFRFLNPSLLGTWPSFQTHFVKPIERDHDAIQREVLRSLIKPLILRRMKDQVLSELPERTTIRHALEFNSDEALRYAYLRRQIRDKLYSPAAKKTNKLEALAEISKLRRFCCHPRLVFPDAPDDSPKLRGLIPLIGELAENGHRTLVFSQYVDFLTLVRARLSELDIKYAYLDGSTNKRIRQEQVDHFQSGQVPLFLISLKAGGLGLNLTAADYVIHLDPWWNPAVGAQATDRAHRLGQTRPVTVYEFMISHSIEEDMFALHEAKKELAELLLKGADEVGRMNPPELATWLKQAVSERGSAGLISTRTTPA